MQFGDIISVRSLRFVYNILLLGKMSHIGTSEGRFSNLSDV